MLTTDERKTLASTIRKAAGLIRDVGWTRGVSARDAEGNDVRAESPKAASFCALGALDRLTFEDADLFVLADSAVAEALADRRPDVGAFYVKYNDEIARNRTHVIALFEAAARGVEAGKYPKKEAADA